MMHIGHQGTDTYTVNNIELPVVHTHNDLGVIIIEELKTNTTTFDKYQRFRTLWSICRAFSHANAKTFLTLCTVFIRRKLEYYIQSNSPSKKKQYAVGKGSRNRK
ncbi:unnamed protein product [Schistosoma curassoni]|nr:unnamed protein product [Schistosoma curassoni]